MQQEHYIKLLYLDQSNIENEHNFKIKSKQLSNIFKKWEEEEFYSQLKQLKIISPLNTYVHRSSSVFDQPKTSYFSQLIKNPRGRISTEKESNEDKNKSEELRKQYKKAKKSRNSLGFIPRAINLISKYTHYSKFNLKSSNFTSIPWYLT